MFRWKHSFEGLHKPYLVWNLNRQMARNKVSTCCNRCSIRHDDPLRLFATWCLHLSWFSAKSGSQQLWCIRIQHLRLLEQQQHHLIILYSTWFLCFTLHIHYPYLFCFSFILWLQQISSTLYCWDPLWHVMLIMMMNVNNNKQRQHCWWLHVIQELYVIPVVPYADATSMWMQFAQPSIQYWYYQNPLELVKSSIRDNGAIQYIQSRKDWSCLFNLFLTMPF